MIWGRLTQEEMFELSDKMRFANIVDEIAYKKTLMYMGNGIEFKSKNPKTHKIWHDMVRLNNLYEVMFRTEQLMSRNGVQFLIITRSKQGKALLNMANPWFPQFANKCYAHSTAARLYISFNIDNKLHWIREDYDTENIYRYGVDEQDNVVAIADFVSKLPDEYKAQLGTYDNKKKCYVFHHNMGFVPVQIMQNKPFPTSFFPFITAPQMWQSPLQTTWDYQTGGYNYASLKDTAYCTGEIEEYEQLKTLQIQNAIIDKTRVVTYGITQTERNRTNGDLTSDLLKTMIVDAGYGNNKGGMSQNGSSLEVLRPSNNLTTYDDSLSNLLREIYRKSGMSYLLQTSTQKTTTESFGAFKESLETLQFMQQYHTEQWKCVIEKMFAMQLDELGDDNSWSFQVKKNTVIDEANKIDNLIKRLEVGADTVIDFISAVKNVDADQAKQIWEENKQWFKANNYTIAKQAGGGTAGVGTKEDNKGGRPSDKGDK